MNIRTEFRDCTKKMISMISSVNKILFMKIKILQVYFKKNNCKFCILKEFSLFVDEEKLLRLVPPRFRSHAKILLQQFNERGTELTWNSDGVIFVDQVAIPESNIFTLFPYLFKMKHPKTLLGFEDFVDKIDKMGLIHLTVKKTPKARPKLGNPSSSEPNWWYIG